MDNMIVYMCVLRVHGKVGHILLLDIDNRRHVNYLLLFIVNTVQSLAAMA